jgi:UDP-N-acetylglucosamine diphosphorylase / glucose-1-phosphate thymidylyltransferase / UDP-N-acetylgalactosamine diphosphorylase / glucosamine-1-phosphate N-acetyltransferase / galactosamine-1-phosphate N-acetyltransferase
MKDLSVIFLAGGDSTRMWPFGNKHLIRFLDNPLLYYPLMQMNEYGVTENIVVVNKKNKKKFELFSRSYGNLNIKLVEQIYPEGISGAILSLKGHIKNEKTLIVGPSDLYDSSLINDFSNMLTSNPESIIAGVTVNDYFPGGYLTVKDSYVNRIIEKPEQGKEPSNTVNFMFHYFKDIDALIRKIIEKKIKNTDVYEKVLDDMIKQGMKVKFLPYKGFWGFLKYPWHILNITSNFLNNIIPVISKNAFIAKSAILHGNILISDGVRIMDNATIIGPVYLGENTVIGNNSLIRESMIGANTVIGFSSEIARSYIGDNCWFHNNYIGDSVIGKNVSMGAGAVLANFRLDEENILSKVSNEKIDTKRKKLGSIIGNKVKIGVNCSIMPGVKIGENCVIGSASLVDRDIPDNSFYKQKNTYILRKNRTTAKDKSR